MTELRHPSDDPERSAPGSPNDETDPTNPAAQAPSRRLERDLEFQITLYQRVADAGSRLAGHIDAELSISRPPRPLRRDKIERALRRYRADIRAIGDDG